MSTVRALISPYDWSPTSEEQLAQKKRVVKGGLIPKLLAICKESKEVDPLCECLDFLAMLGMAPTSLEEDHVKEICPVLMDLAGYDVLQFFDFRTLMCQTSHNQDLMCR